VRNADRHGLLPDDYHLAQLRKSLAAVRNGGGSDRLRTRHLVDLELLATDAYLLLASHLLGGRVDPESFDPGWVATRRSRDLVSHLEEALQTESVRSSLDELDPPQPEYARLMRGLDRYRTTARNGGWPTVPPGPTLRPGEEDERVPTIRERLRIEGYEPGGEPDPVYGSELEQAVRSFQKRHGLDADGVIGPQTLQAFNVSADARADQIALNMERWRWLPQELGSPHVLVNIAGFRLDVVEQNRSVMDMRVIVGRTYRMTPVFSDRISYLVFSPYWNVPHSIATQDILPQVKQNQAYLQEQNMRVFQSWAAEAQPIDPASIDWSRLSAGNFPYRLRQEPGPNNALGTVKFMFPNRFSVYLHDTPSRGLFARSVRTFSSGCIRLERPLELLDYLFRESREWTPAALRSALDTKREQTVRLPSLVPVHLEYWTVWAEDDGTVHFRRDIYGRDAGLEKALEAPPPGS
jgi:murein L,D-transpeptidase YcbB/YkuD